MFSNRALLIALLMLIVIGGGMVIRQCRPTPAAAPKPLVPQELPEE
jgi:hypothetical protein